MDETQVPPPVLEAPQTETPAANIPPEGANPAVAPNVPQEFPQVQPPQAENPVGATPPAPTAPAAAPGTAPAAPPGTTPAPGSTPGATDPNATAGDGKAAENAVQHMLLHVPADAKAGQKVTFSAPNGVYYQVAIPEGAEPGQPFRVAVPAVNPMSQWAYLQRMASQLQNAMPMMNQFGAQAGGTGQSGTVISRTISVVSTDSLEILPLPLRLLHLCLDYSWRAF
jgi:hypothetical protein